MLARNVAAAGPLARLGRRRVGAGGDAGRGRRAAGGRARPVRPAPPAQAGRPARVARPVRRRRRWPRCGDVRRLWAELAATERDAGRGRRLAPASAPGRPTSCGSASGRSRRSTRSPGEDAELAAEETRLGFADTLRTAAEQAREALSSDEGAPDALATTSAARQAARRRPRARPDGRRAGRPARRAGPPARRRRRRRGVVRRQPRDRPGPAGRRLGAPGGADRADPQVRRDHRRGAGLGRGRRQAAARPRGHRRPDRRAGGPARPDPRPSSARSAATLSRQRTDGGRAGSARRSATSSPPWPCRTPRVDHRGHPERDAHARAAGRAVLLVDGRWLRAGVARRRRRGVPARRQHRRRRPAAAQGRVRWRAVPGDAGARGVPGRDRLGARRSSSTRSTPGSAARRPSRSAAGSPCWPAPRRCWSSPTCRRWRRTPTATWWSHKSSDGSVTTSGLVVARRRPGASASCRGCWPASRTPTAPAPTPGSCSRPPRPSGRASPEGQGRG